MSASMALQGALGLGTATARCPNFSSSCPQLGVRNTRGFTSLNEFAVHRNVASITKNGALSGSCLPERFMAQGKVGGRLLGRRGLHVQAKADSDSDFKARVEKSAIEEETGVDADGFVTAKLPEEFMDLMKDEGDPPNYGLMAFAVVVVILAREVIWREIQNWVNLAFLLVVFSVESVQAIAYKALEFGGQPLLAVLEVIYFFFQNIGTFLRFTAEGIPLSTVAFAVLLSTIVLLVGESVSQTYTDSPDFPSRNMLDFAGVLGLGGILGMISAEFLLLSLVSITTYLLAVKKYNPVAGFTPAVATVVAVSGPAIRWPVFVAFVGSSWYRYWKKGYMAQGAVTTRRQGEYPRVLVGLVYLIGIGIVSRFIFAFEALFPSSPTSLDE